MHVFIHVSHSASDQIKWREQNKKTTDWEYKLISTTREKKVKTITNALPNPNQSNNYRNHRLDAGKKKKKKKKKW